MLQNEYLIARIGADADENEPSKVCDIWLQKWSKIRYRILHLRLFPAPDPFPEDEFFEDVAETNAAPTATAAPNSSSQPTTAAPTTAARARVEKDPGSRSTVPFVLFGGSESGKIMAEIQFSKIRQN